MKVRELMERRSKIVADMRAIVDTAEAEDRNLTPEEQNNYDQAFTDADDLRVRIETISRQMEIETDGETRRITSGADGDQNGGSENDDRREYRQAYARWMALGPDGLGQRERRALQADADIYGGYLTAPEQMVENLIKAVDDMVYIRQWATNYPVPNADSLGAVSLDNDPADADWTTELATGSEDSTMSFGKRALHPHPVAKRIKVSRTLIRKTPSAEQLVVDRLGYKFGVTWEKGALTGSGAGQPLGVFTASNDGITTARDVSTGNTTTSIQFDGLIEAKYTLKGQYWNNAKWLFHRDGLKQIAKLKNGDGQYIWRESVRAGEPDQVLGLPVYMSEFAPNTFTTGLYAGILGDFSFYWTADALDFEVQRLVELYAETNQVGLIGRLESDGMPVLAEAFVRVKLA